MKYTKEVLQEAVSKSSSYAGVLRCLSLFQAGGTQCYIKFLIKKYDIDTSHFTGSIWNKGKKGFYRRSSKDILILSSKDKREKTPILIRAMLEENIPYQCSICNLTDKWNSKKLTLQVDHIDGNPVNNTKSNLRFLCPNCHSQQPTFSRRKSRNKPGASAVPPHSHM